MNLNEITQSLQDLDNWGLEEDAIRKTFQFEDFIKSVSFVNKIADLAEEQQHHPDIIIRNTEVTLILKTHSTNGITEKDINFAKAIDEMMRQV